MDDLQRSAPSGIPGIEDLMGGLGFPRSRLYLLQGNPGTGKTTFAIQMLMAAADRGETSLYITLSESKVELEHVAVSHGWKLNKIHLLELSAIQEQASQVNTVFESSELELDQTINVLLKEIERVNPSFIVFDSLSELRLLAQNPLRYRRQLLSFKQYFHKHDATVFMVDDNTATAADDQALSIAHGVISLEKVTPEYGIQRRRLEIVKLRGANFRSGYHDFNIETGGIRVFPRLAAGNQLSEFEKGQITSGISQLDAVLGGGVDFGTSTIFIGPAGSGKSTLAMQFLISAGKAGIRGVYFTFEEGIETYNKRMQAMNPNIVELQKNDTIRSRKVNPADVTPGEFAYSIKEMVEKNDVRVVVIDSINGYLNAMPDQKFLILHLHELLTYLNQKGVATFIIVAQHGIMGGMHSPVDTTYLADTVVLLRFFESGGKVKKAISVVKKRSGPHEETIRELRIGKNGVEVGDPLVDFHGVLTGTPDFRGNIKKIMSNT